MHTLHEKIDHLPAVRVAQTEPIAVYITNNPVAATIWSVIFAEIAAAGGLRAFTSPRPAGQRIRNRDILRDLPDLPSYRVCARRWRANSDSTTPAATEALRDSTQPTIGILITESQVSRTKRDMPLPSEPTTITTGPVPS